MVAGLTALLLLTLLAGLSATTSQWRRAEEKANQADAAFQDEREARERTRRLLYIADMNTVGQAWEESNIGRVKELLERHIPRDGSNDWRTFEWYYHWKECQRSQAAPTISFSYQVLEDAYSPKTGIMALGLGDNTVSVVDVTSRNVAYRLTSTKLQGSYQAPAKVALSADGSLLAYSDYNSIWLRDMTSDNTREFAECPSLVSGLALSSDGSFMVCGLASGSVEAWDVKTKESREIAVIQGGSSVTFCPKSGLFAIGDQKGTIVIWDMTTREELKRLDEAHASTVDVMDFSADGTMLASAGHDKTWKIWNTESWELVRSVEGHLDSLFAINFSIDGKLLATGSRDNTAKIWDVGSGELVETFRGHSGGVTSVRFLADERTLATASGDRTLMFWDLSTNRARRSIPPQHFVSSLAFFPNSQDLASLELQASVLNVWNAVTGEHLSDLNAGREVTAFVVSEQRRVIMGHTDGSITLWDAATGRKTGELSGHSKSVTALAISSNGRKLASGGEDSLIKFWDVNTGEEVAEFPGHEDFVLCLAFSPDEETLVSGSLDGTILIWDLPSLKLRQLLNRHQAAVLGLAYAPSGHLFASSSWDYSVKLWDATDLSAQPDTLIGHPKWVMSVTFSADGRTLISGGGDRTIKIWDVATRQLKCTLKGHTSGIYCVAMSDDQTILASGGYDKTIRLWRAATSEEVEGSEWWQEALRHNAGKPQ